MNARAMDVSPAFLFPASSPSGSAWAGTSMTPTRRLARSSTATSQRCGLDLRGSSSTAPRRSCTRTCRPRPGLPRLDAGGAGACAARRARPRPRATAGQLRGDGPRAGGISYEEALDVLIGLWRETERLGSVARWAPSWRARRRRGGRVRGAAGEAQARLIGNVNASTQFVLTGSKDGVAEALAELTPRALSVLPDDELAHPQRADASGGGGHRAADRRPPSVRDPDVPYYGPEGLAPCVGGDPAAPNGVLLPDAVEAELRGDGRGRAPGLSEVGPGRCLEDGALDRSRRPPPRPDAVRDRVRRR